MPKTATTANVLLAETTRDSLLVVSLATGEQLECPILSTDDGNFWIDTDLPDPGYRLMIDREPIRTKDEIASLGIIVHVQYGPDLTGRIEMSQKEYNTAGYHGYRHEFRPNAFALVSDDEKIQIIAVRVQGRWYPVFDSDYAVDGPAETSSE